MLDVISTDLKTGFHKFARPLYFTGWYAILFFWRIAHVSLIHRSWLIVHGLKYPLILIAINNYELPTIQIMQPVVVPLKWNSHLLPNLMVVTVLLRVLW